MSKPVINKPNGRSGNDAPADKGHNLRPGIAEEMHESWDRMKAGDEQWRLWGKEFSFTIAQARATFSDNKKFGDWLVDNDFGEDVLPKNERAAFIKLGKAPEEIRNEVWDTTTHRSVQTIASVDLTRVTRLRNTPPEANSEDIAQSAQSDSNIGNQPNEDDDPDNRKFEDGLLGEIFRNGPDLSDDDIYTVLEILASRLPLEVDSGFGLEFFNGWLGAWVESQRKDAAKAAADSTDADTNAESADDD